MVQWSELNMSSAHIIGPHIKGFISNAEAYGCCIPHDRHLPKLGTDEVAFLTTFHEQGLALLAHCIFCSLLDYCKIELHHLAPSRILHITASSHCVKHS
jgi:hypothetical protein